ncbi:molybdopterin molybdotransferase MoeA [Helicobacter sp. MIT 99-5507]|uniref:molybdopterin molybdotransferase MoeA n=1 Tax=Helicobacter sp. MIT 99-5507 TaxID=152489 RepID=UPI000E1E316E|nr:molybdopterin molybdotransferase MoeA [Helicobacter sp. MIT 99-5507]RDU57824.1 molybdopterin molybdenumtransferase MoeA [Helicobacter sp. MIT 99-5507]
MNRNITLNQALNLINNANINPLQNEKIFIHDSINRVLYDDIRAIESSPKFNTSSMDGYAFAYSDLEKLQNEGLEILSINKAGNNTECEATKGKCIKTFTGAKIPKNADTIAIVEQVYIKNNRIFLNKGEEVEPYKFIRKTAENYKKGDILIPKGSLINPFHIGILSQNNTIFLQVYRKPRISILTSGDEIAELGEIKENDNFIYSSNNHILYAITKALGCDSSIHNIIKDSRIDIKNAIESALQSSDMVITTGGMSKGDFDFTKEAIKEFGEVVFESVKIKPGKVVSYINCKDKHILALPGNPNSSVVSFLLFGRLILSKMLNLNTNIPIHKAKITNDIKILDSARLEFAPAQIKLVDGIYEAKIIENRQSYMINKLNGAMIIMDKKVNKGDLVDIIILDDLLKF